MNMSGNDALRLSFDAYFVKQTLIEQIQSEEEQDDSDNCEEFLLFERERIAERENIAAWIATVQLRNAPVMASTNNTFAIEPNGDPEEAYNLDNLFENLRIVTSPSNRNLNEIVNRIRKVSLPVTQLKMAS